MTANPVTARLIDGNAIARQIRADLEPRVAALRDKAGRAPGLGLVLVGDDPASHVYVNSKLRTAQETGMHVELVQLPADSSLEDVLAVVHRFNASEQHDGILVQSPLPAAMGHDAERRVIDAISPDKDVDGFSPIAAGRLMQNQPGFAPCTPAGVIEMLDRSGIEIEGRHAVVLGRSDIVGKPMAMLLLHRNATVTICHSRTRDLPAVAASADLLVAAIGRPAFVTPDYVKPGATVIDVGINRVSDADLANRIFANHPDRLAVFNKRGTVLVGDVHPDVAAKAGALTPVPGGVGPLTIAMLMANTVKAAEMRLAAR